MTKIPGRRGGPFASAAAGALLLLALAGCGSTMPDAGTAPASSDAAVVATTEAGTPSATPSPATAAPAPAAASVPDQPPVMPASAPVTVKIPSINLTNDLIHLGLRENGSLEVPADTGNGAPASWYNGSPTPGERGPSVLLGHVNALGGHKGVFADLRKLTPGAEISVVRADGSVATFTMERGELYSKNDFPTFEVYGSTPGSELRLITCDGYDAATGLFDDNYVVYAKLKA